MFLLYGPNTNGGTGSVIYTIEAGLAHVVAALEQLARADARSIEVRRQAASGSTANCVRRWTEPCGTPAARAGKSTSTATIPTSGRGSGAPTGAEPRASRATRTN